MNNLLLKKDLSAEQLAIINGEMNNKQKSKGIAYLIWFFLGGLGGHRYYAGDIGMGIGMTLTLGGLGIWSLIDVFFIGKRIETKNETVEKDIIMNVKAFA
jgi:TM2 domain-containing membrane protein YozV